MTEREILTQADGKEKEIAAYWEKHKGILQGFNKLVEQKCDLLSQARKIASAGAPKYKNTYPVKFMRENLW